MYNQIQCDWIWRQQAQVLQDFECLKAPSSTSEEVLRAPSSTSTEVLGPSLIWILVWVDLLHGGLSHLKCIISDLHNYNYDIAFLKLLNSDNGRLAWKPLCMYLSKPKQDTIFYVSVRILPLASMSDAYFNCSVMSVCVSVRVWSLVTRYCVTWCHLWRT